MPAQDASRRDLALLAHVRVDSAGNERAVIIGNRLPRAGAAQVAHLVSVRNRYTATGFAAPAGTAPIRLVSLKSWRFASTSSPHDATGLLNRIASRSGPLRLPVSTDEDMLARGYVRVGHTSRTGASGSAWYHGPLVPQPSQDRPTLPAFSADDLRPPGDTPDLSLAAAWELGRLLALRSKPFAAALYRWKRARAQLRKQSDPGIPPLPAVLTNWLNDTAVLRGIPFNYLVPAETMLPTESLRFFSLHLGWLSCLLDGALSIGRVSPADVDLDRTLAADLRTTAGDAMTSWARRLLGASEPLSASGFLLRSDAVAGWPDLRIEATAGAAAAAPLRGDQLSANTQLCLFAKEITSVSIRQHEQTLHFGLADAATPWRQHLRVVNITTLAADRIGAAAANRAASAQFAAHLLATAPHVTIPR
jgi:hypothetical protein